MPCQRTHHSSVRRDAFPDDSPEALERFKEASGMTWDEIAWLLGTTAATLYRWRNKGVRPSTSYLIALYDLAADRGLAHLLPTIRGMSAPPDNPGDRVTAE